MRSQRAERLAQTVIDAIDAYEGPYVFPRSAEVQISREDQLSLQVGRVLNDLGIYTIARSNCCDTLLVSVDMDSPTMELHLDGSDVK